MGLQAFRRTILDRQSRLVQHAAAGGCKDSHVEHWVLD